MISVTIISELLLNGAAVINVKFTIASSEGLIDYERFTVTTKIIPVDCEDPDFPAAFALSSFLYFRDLEYSGAEYSIKDCHGDEKIQGLLLGHKINCNLPPGEYEISINH